MVKFHIQVMLLLEKAKEYHIYSATAVPSVVLRDYTFNYETFNFLLDLDTKQLIKELENGYRMDKPVSAPNFVRDVMDKCWEKDPNNRPTFSHLEEIISDNMTSSVTSYYSGLNAPYEKFNDEKAIASKSERFGLAKMLNDNHRKIKSHSQPAEYGLRYALTT